MLTLIGSQLTGFDDASSTKSFSEKTTTEKIYQLISYMLTVFTIVIVCIFGRIARKKMNQINRDEILIRANRKKYERRVDKYRVAMENRNYQTQKINRKLNVVKKSQEQIDEETWNEIAKKRDIN